MGRLGSRRHCEEVSRLTDQGFLAEIAIHAKRSNVREAAVKRITDQSVLAGIAGSDTDFSIRKAAVDRLTDQSLLAGIAGSDTDYFIRKAAVDRVTEESVLVDIFKNEQQLGVFFEVVGRRLVGHCTDQIALAKIAKKAKDPELRKLALADVTDEGVLVDIVKSEENPAMLGVAGRKLVGHCADQLVLARIAEKAEGPELRRMALAGVTDEGALAEIAMSGGFADVCSAATERLANPRLLADVARNARIDCVSRLAVERVTETAGGDLFWVGVVLDAARNGRNLGEKTAKKLVEVALQSPHLLRDNWDELAEMFRHSDGFTRHDDSHLEHHDRFCGGPGLHGDSSSRSHTDRQPPDGLTFPPRPTDF
jgi:hypothetical protein